MFENFREREGHHCVVTTFRKRLSSDRLNSSWKNIFVDVDLWHKDTRRRMRCFSKYTRDSALSLRDAAVSLRLIIYFAIPPRHCLQTILYFITRFVRKYFVNFLNFQPREILGGCSLFFVSSKYMLKFQKLYI